MKIPTSQAWNEFRPEWVVLVITKGEKLNIMPAGWCMHCSFNPQLLAVSIGKSRYTHKILSNSNQFVIAIPNKTLEEVVRFTGSCSGKNVDKFEEMDIETVDGETLPLLKNATLNFECEKHASCDSGDHTIFLGKIEQAHHNNDRGILMNFGQGGDHEFREV